ncbi:MAG: LuxR C-terminal-related transcriptional regulator [Reinekea forsetii]|jgi:LuxR family maltose regulon positive regulatory protein|uniref:LuxR C-terminal-related transcriptional regulator n=1 Tax=Reinekea forsetii TaxID=1336806 RepID=UPI002355FDA6|nr:LuxR C-terminal-related transcriptional regulator [Reinekea forsetii]MDO7643767.1 LuxR C-terminal-related transcriptional regulator [Reinekea forsetii]MDO7675034.1 LuxR C-terminal-related transcriptional regulator [Reinekea forsetii]
MKIKNNFLEQHAILSSKLRCPTRPQHLIARNRLLMRLDENQTNALTLIQAPAGFGKTTLLGSWFEQQENQKGWFTADELDNDFPRFVTYLFALLAQMPDKKVARFCSDTTKINSTNLLQIVEFFCQQLRHFCRPPLLVIDDWHCISEPLIVELLAKILERAHDKMHLVVASRLPILGLSCVLKADYKFCELSMEDLKFTEQETSAFFDDLSVRHYIHQDKQLLQEVDGWVAALQLIRISHLSEPSWQPSLDLQQRRMIGDYLLEEIISTLDQPTLVFLAATSICRRFNLELAQALTSLTSAGPILEHLQQRQLFVTTTGRKDVWYRYHSIFRAAVIKHCQACLPLGLSALNLIAAQWWLERGYYLESADHFIASGDRDALIVFIVNWGWELYRKGQYPVLNHCFDALSWEQIIAQPYLTLTFAWLSLVNERTGLASAVVNEGEQIFLANGELTPTIYSGLAGVKAAIAAIQEDYGEAIQWGQAAIIQADDKQLQWERCQAYLALAEAYFNNCDFPVALAYTQKAEAVCVQNNYTTLKVRTFHLQARILFQQNKLEQSLALQQAALDIGRDQGLSKIFPLDHLYRTHASTLKTLHRYSLAQQYLTLAESIKRPSGNYWRYPTLVEQLIIAMASGKQSNEALLKLATDICQLEQHHRFCQAWRVEGEAALVLYWIYAGRVSKLRSYLRVPKGPAQAVVSFGNTESWTRALAYMARNEFDRAVHLLDASHAQGMAQGAALFCLQVRITQGIAHFMHADPEQGCQMLRAESAELGFEHLFKLLVNVFQLTANECQAEFLIAHGLPIESRFNINFEHSRALIFRVLTRREIRVLYLLTTGLKNKEIATDMNITVSTVRSHIKSINRKLAFETRADAVELARNLKLEA